MTRARGYLYFTAANFYGEGVREKKISPFVFEAIGDDVQAATGVQTASQLSLLEWEHHETPSQKKASGYQVAYLSFSQLNSFRLCPLHYKLRYILNIQPPPSPALSFGSTVHVTLKEFYQLVKSGEKMTKDVLLSIFAKNWIREGYAGKKYEAQMKRRGKEYLSTYFDTEFDPSVETILLEQPFTVPLRLNGKQLKVGGKIDRIDSVGDGKIEIIDYKTGRVPTKREVDADLQLSIYAIAATEVSDPPFNRKIDDVTLTL
jgi:DNA helicase-2/ATP-dependent DNA helicase PcrA